MKKSFIFISLLIFTFLCLPAISEVHELTIEQKEKKQPPKVNITDVKRTVLTGNVTELKELPSGLYGTWEVKGKLIETNDYSKYNSNSYDKWILRKDGDFVTLINPNNGASATITVTAVDGNKATFTRGLKTTNRKDAEQVTITLEGDTFYGTDVIVNETTAYGITMTTVARYKINGTKISGDTLYKPVNRVKKI